MLTSRQTNRSVRPECKLKRMQACDEFQAPAAKDRAIETEQCSRFDIPLALYFMTFHVT